MHYREYEEHELPGALVSLLEATRVRLKAMGRGSADLRPLGSDSHGLDRIPACLSAASLERLIEEGENRWRADDDATTAFKYGTWLTDDTAHQESLRDEISRFMPGASPSGLFWYPAGGYMGWHTNANRPGERLFCTYAEEGGKSFFRFRDPRDARVHTSWDRSGWTYRRFGVGGGPDNLFWHCVFSAVERISCGFYLPERAIAVEQAP